MSNGKAPARPANEGDEHTGVLDGLTKREELAARAMQGLCSEIVAGVNSGWDVSPEQTARDAVVHADALLAELEKDQ